ncbi:hypothetical protein XENOCAPTIV_001895, partial [Xenoophorus captivus]
RTLKNVLHFLVDIGDICNDKLGAPFRKCQDAFAQARSDCTDLLGEFSFLCDIVDGFLPLCNLARVSFHLSYKERKAVLMGVTSVLRHLVIGSLLVALDFLVFWILDQLHHQVKGDVVARAPAQVVVQVNGSGYASDIYRDLVASFNILQRRNITVISRKCLLEPSEPKYSTTFLLGTDPHGPGQIYSTF